MQLYPLLAKRVLFKKEKKQKDYICEFSEIISKGHSSVLVPLKIWEKDLWMV